MLSFDQIMPAIASLTELYSRPKTNARVASQNQKIGLVLRKKIAQSVLQGLANKNQTLQPKDIKKLQNEFLDQLNKSILHMTLISSVGIDFSVLTNTELENLRKDKTPLNFYNLLDGIVDAEGKSLIETFFEGTEISNLKERKRSFSQLYKQSEKALQKSLKYLIRGIEKEVERSRDSGEFVDGTLTSEMIADVIVFSLTGRDDASDEESIFHATGLRKKMSAKSVFKTIYDEAMRFRKSFARESASGNVNLGEGKFSWLKKSKKILGCMQNFKFKVWRIVEKQLKKGISSSFGDFVQGEDDSYQDAQDRMVAQSYEDLVSSVQVKQTKEDTTERRTTLVEARQNWEDDPNDDNLKDYMLRVLDLVNSRHRQFPTITDCRTLLDNIDVISEGNSSMYKKIRGLVYDRLFRMGQLNNAEIQLLDGVYSEDELWKEKQKIAKIYDMKGFIKYFEDDYGLDAVDSYKALAETVDPLSDEIGEIHDFLSGLKDILKYAPTNLHLKNHVATYEYLLDTFQKSQEQALDLIEGWLNTFQSGDIQDDLIATFNDEERLYIDAYSDAVRATYNSLLEVREEIISLLSAKNSYKPTEDDEWSGGTKLEGSHPLMSYSIYDYPLTAKALDAGRNIPSVSDHATISAVDLRVFQELKDGLSLDAGFKAKADNLNEQRSLVNKLVDSLADAINFVSQNDLKAIKDQNALKKAEKENKKQETSLKSYFSLMKSQFEDFFGTLTEEQEEIFNDMDALTTVPKATRTRQVEVKAVIKKIQNIYDADYSTQMRKLFEDNMDGAISVVLQEVLENETSEEERKGQNVLRHRATTDRVQRFLKRDATMAIFQEFSKDSLRKKGSGKKADAAQVKSAKKVALEAKGKAEALGLSFEDACKEKGLQTNNKGEALIKNTKDVGTLRKVIKALAKTEQERTVDSYIEKAKGMDEKDIQSKLEDLNREISSAMSDFKDSTRASILYSQVTSHLSQGFVNKAKKSILDLKSFGEEQINSLSKEIDDNTKYLKGLDVKAQAKLDGLTEKELQDEINGSLKTLQDKKKSLISVKKFKSLLDDLREMNILGTIYNFEDRIADKLKAQTTQEIEEITAQRDERLSALNKKKKAGKISNEEATELRLIEAGEDETFGAKLKRKYQYQRHGISEAKSMEVEARGLNKTFTKYAPAVEQKEEKIRESARKMVERVVDQNISFDEIGLGQTYEFDNLRTDDKGKGVLGVAGLKGMASRTRSLRKLMALKKNFSEGNKFKKLLEADVDLRPLANVIEASPACFPSVDLSLDRGLLKVYLALPYYPNNVLVQNNGQFYALSSSNVFADPFSERNIQALMRYLIASSNPLVISHGGDQVGYMGVEPHENPQLEDFYKNFLNSASSDAFKELAEDYATLMGEDDTDTNSATRKEYLTRYENEYSWWSEKYTAQEMMDAYKLLKEGRRTEKLEEMVRVVLEISADEELTDADYTDLQNSAYMVVYKNKVDGSARKFFFSGTEKFAHIKDLLGNGLSDYLTESESNALNKALFESTNQSLIKSDILGEKYNNKITGSVVVNFTGLIADLNVLLACASSSVSVQEMADLEIDPDCVEKVREIFGAEIDELDKIVQKG